MPPILDHKRHAAPTIFEPAALLREARRQKRLAEVPAPAICVLDPDGDIVRRLTRDGRARKDASWPCYHTDLHRFHDQDIEIGIVGCAVGAPFAVLVAEELFACGCQFLISVTSAGQLVDHLSPPYFILIERALRDEGTSYHYMPAADYSEGDEKLLDLMAAALNGAHPAVVRGKTWTTDAPFRETAEAIAAMRAQGLLAVEMEAAALYAFACARAKPVLCLAHVTNQMGRVEGDFEKGAADGTSDALALIGSAARTWLRRQVTAGGGSCAPIPSTMPGSS
jgi:uridine phosphorylase